MFRARDGSGQPRSIPYSITNTPSNSNTTHIQGGGKYDQKEGLFVKQGEASAQGVGDAAPQLLGRGFMMGLKQAGCAA